MAHIGPAFLHDRDPRLHCSPQVEDTISYLRAGGEYIPNDPLAKIGAYVGFLASREHANVGTMTGDPEALHYQISGAVVTYETLPDGYLTLQQRIARDSGYGTISITPQVRIEYAATLERSQSTTLQAWADYLTGEAKDRYPPWFKDYVFTSVTKLASYNKRTGQFDMRSKDTVANFPDFNQEALDLVFDTVRHKAKALALAYRNKVAPPEERVVLTEEEQQEQQAALAITSDFNKLYSEAIRESANGHPSAEELMCTEGEWRVFAQSTDPDDVNALVKAVQGRGTGWCTRNEGDAASQLRGGDFWAYFTKNKYGAACLPRIAIRMQSGRVAEVRGIVGGERRLLYEADFKQNIESNMIDIALAKLDNLPGGPQYAQKVADMKQLTAIERKLVTDPGSALEDEDVLLLYEMVRDVQNFGLGRDPRIEQLLSRRAAVHDRAAIWRLLPEAMQRQFTYSYEAYGTIVNTLNRGRSSENVIDTLSFANGETLFSQRLKAWKKGGIYKHMQRLLLGNHTRYTLVMIPNTAISNLEILDLATAFNNGNKPRRSEELYRYARKAKQRITWSGTVDSDDPIRFTLVASDFDPYVVAGDIGEQLALYRARRDKYQNSTSGLRFHIPSLFDAIAHWYVLRAQGLQVGDHILDERTSTLHLDLCRKHGDGYANTPYSSLFGSVEISRTSYDNTRFAIS